MKKLIRSHFSMRSTRQSRDSTSTHFEQSENESRISLRLLLLVVVPLVLLLVVLTLYLTGGRYVKTDNAFVKSSKVPISADVSGTIAQVMVQENQRVTEGDPLFQLDPASFEIAVARAKAQLAKVRTDLQALRASYQEKQAEIELAQSRYQFAQKEQKRLGDLLQKGYVSPSDYDQAQQQTTLAQQQITALNRDLQRISQSLGGQYDTPIEAHPNYLAAQAELEQAELNLQRTQVKAPMDGLVSKLPGTGQYLHAGASSAVVVADRDPWIEANFPETDLTYVTVGQPVTIQVDTYPDQKWHGTVKSLSPATGSEFSIIPAQNATGNWVKVAQRVPIRISIEQQEGMPQLRSGLSTEVEIDTGHKRSLLGLSL